MASVLASALMVSFLVANAPAASADPFVPVTVTILRVFGTSPDSDNSPGDYYAKVRIGDNAFQGSPDAVESGDFAPYWTFTETVDAGQPIPVTIELWDDDNGFDDHIDINPVDGDLNANVILDYTTGTWTAADLNMEHGVAVGDGDYEIGNELWNGWAGGLLFDISPDIHGDLDGDGIPDGVERFGVRRIDGTLAADMAALGADPCRKSLAVEIDWFERPDHSHRPSDAAIAEIEAAFADAPVDAVEDCPYAGFPKADTGVDLILDVSSAIDVSADLDANGPYDLDQLAETNSDPAHFDPDRRPYFRYNVWAHTISGGSTSGKCCAEGTDFITSLGKWNPWPNGTVRDQSSTFMHELGHALGLRHGGADESTNYKPNYVSVMNYMFQGVGIPDADLVTLPGWDKTAFEQWARTDYSREALDDLDETNLDENAGIGDDDGDALTAWYDPAHLLRSGRGDGALDWDWDSPGGAGPFEAKTATDLNPNKDEACLDAGKDGTYDSVLEGDDFVSPNDSRVYSGPNRTCETTALDDDTQIHETNWQPPNVLKGASDWDKIAYYGPALPGSGDDAPPPHDDITFEESQRVKLAWQQAINQAPVAEAGGPYQVPEGSTVPLDGTGSTDPNNDPMSFAWTPADHLDDPTVAKPNYSGMDDTVDQLTLTVKDPQGLSDSDTTTVTVTNVVPSVDGTGATIDEGQTAAVSATFTDFGVSDTHTATIDWGDGTPAQAVPVTQAAGSGSLNGFHVYGDNGTFTVTISVTDDDGGVATDAVAVGVGNLDPTATLDDSGSVTFPGGDAVVSDAGTARQQAASAMDPGSDDLTFAWDAGPSNTYFNNGVGPDPLPSPGGTFPFAADDDNEVTFGLPGVYTIGLTVSDDDGGSHGVDLSQVVVGTADKTFGAGYWKQQYSGKGNPKVDPATLEGYLEIVDHVSSVFSEAKPLVTPADAAAILSPKGGDKRAVATADLLSAWLHFASGAVPWDAAVPVGGNQFSPYLSVMGEIEAIVLNPDASGGDLLRASALAQRTMQAH